MTEQLYANTYKTTNFIIYSLLFIRGREQWVNHFPIDFWSAHQPSTICFDKYRIEEDKEFYVLDCQMSEVDFAFFACIFYFQKNKKETFEMLHWYLVYINQSKISFMQFSYKCFQSTEEFWIECACLIFISTLHSIRKVRFLYFY